MTGSLPIGLDLTSDAGRERVRLAIDNFGLAFFETDMSTGQVVLTPNAFTMFGLPPPERMPVDRTPFWECYHPDDKGWARAAFEADLRGERGRDSYCERVRIIRQTDHQQRWIEFLGRMFGPPGARTHIVGMLRDVTEQVEAEERQRLLMREVNHRANNTLAVVQSLVRLTQGATLPDYRRELEHRILSLARTHSLLQRSDWRETALSAAIDTELAAWRDRVDANVAEAPLLAAHAVQPFAMMLHELATNAAKHGAFAAAGGRVRLTAQREGEDLRLGWIESGGRPILAPPARIGTGMAVVKAQLRQLGGTWSQVWHPQGLRIEIRIPVSRWSG